MSELLSSTSIYVLSQDILIYIFTLNADMFAETRALQTTRISSQVCREWRDLLLGASFLWARLIDLDRLYYNRDHVWRNELIIRSGDAPLWIKWVSNGYSIPKQYGYDVPIEYITRFTCRIIRENWHRIQKLVINGIIMKCRITHSMLCHPAPYLHQLTVSLGAEIVPTQELPQDGSTVPLFSNHAPFLRILNLS